MEEGLMRLQVVEAIERLPEEPFTWVCYNEDFIDYYQNLIKDIRGSEFFYQYTRVVGRDQKRELDGGKIFFDPTLHYYIGNGYD
mgnify:CR=1 FL=1|tara:strand:- start:13965 stop:14216 length:252 start_codon:yes stop_codon:yes gene_type:complete